MVDSRIAKLAEILVDYSLDVKRRSVIQVSFDIEAEELALEVYKRIVTKGAYVKLDVRLDGFGSAFFGNAADDQLKYLPRAFLTETQGFDGFVSIVAHNETELEGVASEKLALWQKACMPLAEARDKRGNWVVCGFPGKDAAKDAGMSLKDYEDFVYSSTNIDWVAMSKRQDLLKKVLDNGRKVRVIGHGTDLTFSIKGRKGIKCDGKFNMPDGEVFTCPKRESMEGKVSFNFPTTYQGKRVEGVVLEFRGGKVVDFKASKGKEFLKRMLDIDDGAMYVGEFGMGMNYSIKKFTNNTLFDEKIGGTIHLALGRAYKEAGGKNKSAIHWDMVTKPQIVLIDDKVILKDGEFMF